MNETQIFLVQFWALYADWGLNWWVTSQQGRQSNGWFYDTHGSFDNWYDIIYKQSSHWAKLIVS